MTKQETALRRAKVWLSMLVDEFYVDPAKTTFTVKVNKADGSTKMEVEKLNLAEDMQLIDEAIAECGETDSEKQLRLLREKDGRA